MHAEYLFGDSWETRDLGWTRDPQAPSQIFGIYVKKRENKMSKWPSPEKVLKSSDPWDTERPNWTSAMSVRFTWKYGLGNLRYDLENHLLSRTTWKVYETAVKTHLHSFTKYKSSEVTQDICLYVAYQRKSRNFVTRLQRGRTANCMITATGA
jgi:hypothetical protein